MDGCGGDGGGFFDGGPDAEGTDRAKINDRLSTFALGVATGIFIWAVPTAWNLWWGQ
jgi:hypothetical protein